MAAPPQQSTETEGELNKTSGEAGATDDGAIDAASWLLGPRRIIHEDFVSELIAHQNDGNLETIENAFREDRSSELPRRFYSLLLVQSLRCLSEAERSARSQPIDWAGLKLCAALVQCVKNCQPRLVDEVLVNNIARNVLYNVAMHKQSRRSDSVKSRSIQFIREVVEDTGDSWNQVLRLELHPVPRNVASPDVTPIIPHPRMLLYDVASAHKQVSEGYCFDPRYFTRKTTVSWSIWEQTKDRAPSDLQMNATSLRAATACLAALPVLARFNAWWRLP